VKPQAGSADIE